MNKTTNYGLGKPLQTEYYNVDIFNANADIVDNALNTIKNNVTAEITRATNAESTLSNDLSKKVSSSDLTAHTGNSDIHVTATQKSNWNAAYNHSQTSHDYIPNSKKGVANGVATLDSSGTIPEVQLPSYVDDVLEYATKNNFPTTGEKGKIYVDIETGLTYRWSGTAYILIASSYELPTATTETLGGVKTGSNITNTDGVISITSTDVVNALGFTPGTSSTDTTYTDATTTKSGLMSGADKTKLNGITESADAVSFSQTQTTGDEVGKITINGTATSIYSKKEVVYGSSAPTTGLYVGLTWIGES